MLPHGPDYEELLNACARYVQLEQADTNYEVAHGWVKLHWNDPIRVAGGIRIIEETWNRAFYGRGIFDVQKVVQVIERHKEQLNEFKLRQIETFSVADEQPTQNLWVVFFEALKPRNRNLSPYVGTAKALHLVAPSFFVPFDNAISRKYNCNIDQPAGYIKFQHSMAELACHVLDTFVTKHGGNREKARGTICGRLYIQRTGSHYTKSLAKLLDEYNWVTRLD